MSRLSDDIARGCLENGEPIEALWGHGEWSEQSERQLEPDPYQETIDTLQQRIDNMISIAQKYQPAGSPPGGDEQIFLDYVLSSQQKHIDELEEKLDNMRQAIQYSIDNYHAILRESIVL
jgi:hypothetical protein